MNVLDAAYHVVHDYPGGAESLGPRLGRRGIIISSEVAKRGSAKFGLEDAVKVTLMTQDYRILDAFNEACGSMRVPLPSSLDASDDDVLMSLGQSSKEFADLCQQVVISMADGLVSDNELERMERDRADLIAQLHHLGEVIRARNLASKPAHIKAGEVL